MAKRPALYRTCRYRADMEALAFERLSALDLPGCRTAFSRLLAELDPAPPAARTREVVQLLLDVLQRVNRRVHRALGDDAAYQISRVRLIEEFATCESVREARRAFRPALQQLLAPLGPQLRAMHPVVARAKAFIRENYQRRVYLSSVAQALNISPNYLSRLFRRETGTTLTASVQRVRLEHARLLLAEGTHSMAEIAYRVGYQNYRDFYRNCVKYEDGSPREVQRDLLRKARPRAV